MLKKIKTLKYKIFFFVAVGFLLSSNHVDAATLSISPSSTNVNVNDSFSVKVTLNADGTAVNNAEATVSFNKDVLDVVSVSKSSSVFSMWVEDPSFSNLSGQVNFNGGLPNPGFSGSNGNVLSINFKAKKEGSSNITFSNSAVRANDGLGTDVLGSKNSGTIKINPLKIVEKPATVVEKISTLVKPVILSSTHPDQEKWYSANDVSFNWRIPNDVNSIQTSFNNSATSIPAVAYDSSVSQKTFKNVKDGVSYFHLKYNGSSPVSHFQVHIDTTPPKSFIPTLRNNGNNNYLKIETEDATSGIDHYTASIDEYPLINIINNDLLNGEYLLPILPEGVHTIEVSAYDKAGNSVKANISIESGALVAPEISLSKNEITKGESVKVYGKTEYPGQKVKILLSNKDAKLKEYTQNINRDGSFVLDTDIIKNIGVLNISAQIVFMNNVMSPVSNIINLNVNDSSSSMPNFIVIWLIVLSVVVVVLVILVLVYLRKLSIMKKDMDRKFEIVVGELQKIPKVSDKSFKAKLGGVVEDKYNYFE